MQTEKLTFYANVRCKKTIAKKILCKIVLDKKKTAPINLSLYPSKNNLKKLENIHEFTISGNIKAGSKKELLKKIQINKAYRIKTISKHISDNMRTQILCQPYDLKIINFIRNHNQKILSKTPGIFWLTDSLGLRPSKIMENSSDGSVNVKTIKSIKFTLIKGILLNFETHFNYVYNKQTNEEIKFEELVAEFSIPKTIKTHEIKKHINYLDDFLLLVSFAERRHCICIGFETVCQERHTIFYKRDRIIPIREKHSDSELLIDISLFEKYINTVYGNFIHNKNKDLIRQAIQYTIGSEDKTIESSFKALFSALETVLLYFRKEAKFETVLPNHDWLIFQKEIKKWIKLKKPSTKERRTLMYEKIPELNRISFASTFKKFCLDYKIDLNDLWPIIDNSEGISLLQLRNKLTHGELFSLEHLNSLVTAKIHLQWIVERLILTLLGWPVSDSNVSEGYLIFYNPYKNWEVDRKVFQNC